MQFLLLEIEECEDADPTWCPTIQDQFDPTCDKLASEYPPGKPEGTNHPCHKTCAVCKSG